MRNGRLTLCYFALLLPCATLADEGRIPIAGPKVITQPGAYVVTRDILVPSGIALDVRADGVTIDLNGHTISSTGILEDLLSISGCGARGVAVRNGHFQGGRRAIHAIPPGPCRLSVHDVQIGDPDVRGILVDEAGQVEIHGIMFWFGPGP